MKLFLKRKKKEDNGEISKHLETKHTNKYSKAKAVQSCPTLCNPMDCSPPGSSVYGVSQARILEWFAISSSRESSYTVGGNVNGYNHYGE